MDGETAVGVLGLAAGLGGAYYGWRAMDAAAVGRSRDRFIVERDDLRERTGQLSELAADMHIAARPALERIGGSTLLWDATMRPPLPVPLSAVSVDWQDVEAPLHPRLHRLTQRRLPKESKWRRYARYSSAMGALARPRLFEDRPSFRLAKADWLAPAGPRLVFGPGQYFDLVDQNEAVAHELAAATRKRPHSTPSWRRTPMRAVLRDDPLSLSQRVVLPSAGTLTVRRTSDGEGAFFLLLRDAGAVATGGGVYGPIPAGMVQPASMSPLAHRKDVDLWRTIMREYNEELLGAPEATGATGREVDYEQPPYSLLNAALANGSLRVWCFGMGLEPLNLAVCLLTVAVFEAETFDVIFADAVDSNDEGFVISGPRQHGVITGLPLTAESVDDLPRRRMSSPAAGLLQLALQHRDLLLAPASD
ncbi:transcriptional regulator [Streptomyces umbrinus]|uniref:transcriptional regulator n=1 Tax=Streptomyces umbrinus TaxID=67370 RepID=UPI0033F2837E